MDRRNFLKSSSLTVGIAAVGASGLLAGCSGDDAADDDNLGFNGTVLGYPYEKPDVEFADTEGKPFNLATDTDSKLTLLLFGYTSCPDICPVHLSILANTLKDMTGPASKTNVVFVGVDTARDTPEVMREFLDNRDPNFIGLTAAPEVIEQALVDLKLPATVIEPAKSDGTYTVGHASQIIAFTPDNLGHIVYPFGTLEQQWAEDLPRLVDFEWPDTRR